MSNDFNTIPSEMKVVKITCDEPLDLVIRQELHTEKGFKVTGLSDEHVTMSQEGEEFHLIIKGDIEPEEADILLLLPAEVSVEITGDTGEIEIVNAFTNIKVTNSSGNISLDEFSGKTADITAESGDINVFGSTGKLNISLVSGDVVINDFEGDISCKGVSGNVIMNEITGNTDIDLQS
jgi:DUF4097 and DUF4098 domain-containing protein YvlB